MARDSRRRRGRREKNERDKSPMIFGRPWGGARVFPGDRSKIPVGLRGCFGKIRHTNRHKITQAINRMQHQYRCEFVSYPCDICGGIHLARKSPTRGG